VSGQDGTASCMKTDMAAVAPVSVPRRACREVALSCACLSLRKAARSVTHVFREALRPVGLQPTQFTLLVALRLLDAVTVSDLAEEVVTDPTTLSRNLAVMERLGLITFARGDDRRTRLVRLADAGHEALAQALPIWQETNERLIRAMGGQQLAEVLRQVDTLTRVAVTVCEA
jgi:DNA-binding MarR family transcriptional regulator